MRALLVVKDREFPSSGNMFVDGSGADDVSLPVLGEVSPLVEALRFSGSYENVHQLCARCTLISKQMNVGLKWSPDEVFVSVSFVP